MRVARYAGMSTALRGFYSYPLLFSQYVWHLS